MARQDDRTRLLELLSSLRLEGGRARGLPDTLTGAAALGDVVLMAVFLDRGADLEERSIGFASPLSAACAAGHAEAVAFLLARGAKLRPEDAFNPPIRSVRLPGVLLH